jgi:hypothetical protein
MKKLRIALIVLSLISIFSFVLIGVLSQGIQEGKIAKNWIAVAGLLLTGCIITNVFLSYRYAWKSGRNAGLWALGAFLLPYIVPVILSFLSPVTERTDIHSHLEAKNLYPENNKVEREKNNQKVHKRKLFDSVPAPPSFYRHKSGFGKTSQWSLDRLRLFCIMVPGTFKWKIVTSTQDQWYFFPDLLAGNDAHMIYDLMEDVLLSGNINDLTGIKICMAPYDGPGLVLDLKKLKNSSIDLLAALYHYRTVRSETLSEWLSNDPQVLLWSRLGSKAVLNKDGFHLNNRSLSWQNVKSIKTESLTSLFTTTHLYVLPEGRSGRFFDLKKGKYALKLIPTKQKELYAAECQFWKYYVNKELD